MSHYIYKAFKCQEALEISQNQYFELGASLNYSIDSLESIIFVLSEPILVNLQAGWNIIGFTCNETHDAVESTTQIDNILIVMKSNDGDVYIPEYGFNGIGDLIPGHGYQIKITEDILGFSLCY